MDSTQHSLETPVISKLLDRPYSGDGYANEEDAIVQIAFLLWNNSQIYKQNRMNRIALYERLYNNELPKKERQLFNICLPIFGGFEDALQANLTDPVKLQFQETNPEDYLVVPKIQAQWEAEKDGLAPHQMWNSKARDLMHDALLSGRSIAKIYAENEPTYRNIFESVNYSNFHCQPLGGAYLENHLFVGEEGIYMTLEDIISNESFPKEQRDKIANFSYTDEWWQQLEDTYGTHFARYRSMFLNINSNTFTGTKTLMLCQFIITRRGVRWYCLFDPISKNWLKIEQWKDMNGSDLYPYKSAATHQDSQNFWSKGFSDDIFSVAIVVSTLLNQELTNREKSNFNARAYDPTMFTDEAKLDAAQYIPDRLVPVDTMGGVRKIEEGIYSFTTPQLQGTIDLVGWMQQNLGGLIGMSDLSGATGPSKGKGKQNATVQIAQAQQVAKRIGFRAEPFKEMFGQIGEAYVEGLKEFMPAKLAVKLIGEDGYTQEDELKRVDLSRTGTIGVKVLSTGAEDADNQAKANKRIQALTMLAQDPNVNSQWRTEQTLKTVGGFDDQEIKMGMDVQTYGSKKQIAHASKAIQDLLRGKIPDIYFGADTTFLQYIQDFVTENKNKVMKRKVHPKHGIEVYLIALFTEYMQEYVKPPTDPKTGQPQIDPKTGQPAPGIVQANESRKIQKAQKQQAMAQMSQGGQDKGKDSSQHKPGGKAMPGVGNMAPLGV
jgi:hypothetical protein